MSVCYHHTANNLLLMLCFSKISCDSRCILTQITCSKNNLFVLLQNMHFVKTYMNEYMYIILNSRCKKSVNRCLNKLSHKISECYSIIWKNIRKGWVRFGAYLARFLKVEKKYVCKCKLYLNNYIFNNW